MSQFVDAGGVELANRRTVKWRLRSAPYLWDLLRALVGRDIKLRYRRSALGLAWSLVNPLSQLLVFNFVFSSVLPLNVPNYTPFLFAGLLAWNWFQTSLFQATTAIVDNRELIRRPGFPPAMLPLITVSSQLIHFLLALPILALFLRFSGIQPTWAAAFLPVVIAVQFLFNLSLAYWLATIHVTFRDTQYLLGIALLLGFYLTPIFYDSAAIPERFQSAYQLNPMLHFLDAYRTILLDGQMPDITALVGLGAISITLLALGYSVFMRASYHFAEEL